MNSTSFAARASSRSGDLEGRVELLDEIIAVIDQQLQLPVDALVRSRTAQIRLPNRDPGDRERVDRVGLAARPAGTPLRHRQLRRLA